MVIKHGLLCNMIIMSTNRRLLELESRIIKLERKYKEINDISNYYTSEVQLIEVEATNSVLEFLKEKYRGLIELKPSNDYIKHLYHPKTEAEIIEFDGIIILTNDPKDIKNPKLNVCITENKILNTLYEVELKKYIRELDDKIELHKSIIINNVLSPNIIEEEKILKNSKKYLEAELSKFKNMIIIEVDGKDQIYTRILVIIETKHKVTREEINKKLQQLIEIKDVISNAKLYYQVVNPVKDYQTDNKRLLKQLRRKTLNTKEFNVRKK